MVPLVVMSLLDRPALALPCHCMYTCTLPCPALPSHNCLKHYSYHVLPYTTLPLLYSHTAALTPTLPCSILPYPKLLYHALSCPTSPSPKLPSLPFIQTYPYPSCLALLCPAFHYSQSPVITHFHFLTFYTCTLPFPILSLLL